MVRESRDGWSQRVQEAVGCYRMWARGGEHQRILVATLLLACAVCTAGCKHSAPEPIQIKSPWLLHEDVGEYAVSNADGFTLAYVTWSATSPSEPSIRVVRRDAISDGASECTVLEKEGRSPSLASSGLVYLAEEDLSLIDRNGETKVLAPSSEFENVAASPLGERVAGWRTADYENTWVLDLRGGTSTPVPLGLHHPGPHRPVWVDEDTFFVNGFKDGRPDILVVEITNSGPEVRTFVQNARDANQMQGRLAYVCTTARGDIPEGALCIASMSQPELIEAWLAPRLQSTYVTPVWLDARTLVIGSDSASGGRSTLLVLEGIPGARP